MLGGRAIRHELDQHAGAVISGSKLVDWYSRNPPDQDDIRAIAARARDLATSGRAGALVPPDIETWLRRLYVGMPEDVQLRRETWNNYKLLISASGLKSIDVGREKLRRVC
jgi:hypothetical protein